MTRERNRAFGPNRRDVVKAVGAGTVLTALGGRVLGQTDGETDETPTESAGTVGDDGGPTGTVHRVEMRIQAPPTNPERPADFFYQPTGLHVRPGDVVQFVAASPDHNVVFYHPAFGMRRRVPTGVHAVSSPLLGWQPGSIGPEQVEPPGPGPDSPAQEDDGAAADEPSGAPEPDHWLVALETPGVYDLLCSPHEQFGMAMRVVVGDETDARFETSDPAALPEPRAGPAGLARVTLTDPALEPSAIVEAETVAWESLAANQSRETPTATETPAETTGESAPTETDG